MNRARWQPRGIVALLTDFGLLDPYVGVLKGVILARAPSAQIVDLTHAVPPQDVRRAAWFLRHSRQHFPEGTVFVCVVDPGVGSERCLLAAFDHGQAFLGPDNGVLVPALSDAAEVHQLDVDRFALAGACATFHGRDVLAPAAAALLYGAGPQEMGERLGRAPVLLELARARALGADELEAQVLFADHYGNLVLSVMAEDLGPERERWQIEVAGQEIAIRRTYADARPGELLGLLDSYAALEIAVRDGSAAARLELGPGAAVRLRKRP